MPSPNCVGAPHTLKQSEQPLLVLSPAQEAAKLLLDGPARYVCLAGGTRSGKTFLIVRAIVERALSAPESRHAILRFRGNAAWASIAGETLPRVSRLCFPEVQLTPHRGDGTYALKNGARISIAGLDDKERVEKILGHEYASIFLNEASQISYESALVAFTRLAQVVPGLAQRAYVDLNPTSFTHWTNVLFGDKRDPLSRQPLVEPDLYARAFLNPRDNRANLSPAFLRSLETLPERQRRRFYEGVYVADTEDALWTYEVIDANRCGPERIAAENRTNVVVGVDPSGARGPDDTRDATGIVVAALGTDGEAYVLADRSIKDQPVVWARRAVAAFEEFSASCIVAETNYGGGLVEAVIHSVAAGVPVREVVASRGKAVRAEPISARYAQGQVHHVGRFPKLEEQLCAFTTSGYGGADSPDNADAAVWALTYLFNEAASPPIVRFYKDMTDGEAP